MHLFNIENPEFRKTCKPFFYINMCVLLDLIKHFLRKVSTRYTIAFTIFLCTVYIIMLRANLSINLVAMVPVNGNLSSNVDTGMNWSASERGIVLSSYFWGCTVGNFFGGPLLERVSIRISVFVCIIATGLLTALGPIAARQGYEFLIITRIVIGILSGFCYPANHSLISKWSTPHEKGLFVGAIILGSSGTFFAWSIGGYVVDTFGWEWGFYVFGMFSPIMAALWWVTVYDTPEEHPRISDEEQKYLAKEIKRDRGTRVSPPYRQIYMSAAVWSSVILNFGTGWGLNFLLTSAPNYITNTLGYSIVSTGFLSAFIYLFRSIVAFGAGIVSDILLNKGIINVKMLRGIGVLLSHLLPGGILLLMLKTGLPTMSYIIIIGFSMSLNGMVTLSSSVNPHDLTTNYVSTVTGFVFTAVTLAGIVTPLVTAYITKEDETNVEVWQSVYIVGASMYLLSGIQFYVFGSSKHQPWDKTEAQKDQESGVI